MDLRANDHGNQASFDGMMLSALSYGALVMLYFQVTQVLLRRPKRDRIFWCIIFYSTGLFPLTTIAFVGKFSFAQTMYMEFSGEPLAVKTYILANSRNWANVMSQIGITLVPWFGDVLMLYRLMVIWNNKWLLVLIPGFCYLARLAMSLPLLISLTQDVDMTHASTYGTTYYSLCVTLNTIVTLLIAVRLHMLRPKAERVLGKLQASLYTSPSTIFVESGAFFTLWAITYLVSRVSNSWFQDIFLQPYSYLIGLTRMLIILRMAQDRAWSRDIIKATDTGVLDWEVSSVNSLPLNFANPDMQQKLPNKFREDSLSTRSSNI